MGLGVGPVGGEDGGQGISLCLYTVHPSFESVDLVAQQLMPFDNYVLLVTGPPGPLIKSATD